MPYAPKRGQQERERDYDIHLDEEPEDSGQDLKTGPSEYEAAVLSTQTRRLVLQRICLMKFLVNFLSPDKKMAGPSFETGRGNCQATSRWYRQNTGQQIEENEPRVWRQRSRPPITPRFPST
jgi:hypothetical protein